MLAPMGAKKELTVSCTFDPQTPFALRGDQQHLRQVLINLVNNAIKYTEKGSVRLEVSLVERAGKKYIQFDVMDTGIGISKEQQKEIFEKFYQVDTSSTRKHEGVGLGLSICKPIVEAMSGNIGMELTLGEGSHFWFNLPYIEAETDKVQASA